MYPGITNLILNPNYPLSPYEADNKGSSFSQRSSPALLVSSQHACCEMTSSSDSSRLLETAETRHRRYSSRSSSVSHIITTPTSSTPSLSPTSDMPPNVDDLRESVQHVHISDSTTNGTKRGPRSHMSRKQSSPMMPAFMVSAPGKVIVFGEHAVVHGKVRETRVQLYIMLMPDTRLPLLLPFPCGHIS